jgi:DNA-binding Lrp family transcriptional regulator
MIAGGGCIDDADVLRCGATSRVLGHRVMAPSTVGTFLRAFGLAEIPEVRHAERLFGDPDYLLRVASADIAAYQTLRDQKLATLPGVGRLTSTIVMKRVVDERPFPLAPASPRPHPKCR